MCERESAVRRVVCLSGAFHKLFQKYASPGRPFSFDDSYEVAALTELGRIAPALVPRQLHFCAEQCVAVMEVAARRQETKRKK